MEEKILKKEQITKFYDDLASDYNFYTPTKVKGNIIFGKIQKPEDIELNYFNSKVPPKEVLFPKMETLFEYKKHGKDIEIEEVKDLDEKNIIFGIRPCDAYSFNLLENFFGFGQFKDIHFLKRRENTILIGIGCNIPKQTCFCTSLDLHPFRKDDVDIFLADLGGKYLVTPVTDEGKEIINKLSWLSEAKKADIEEAEKLAKKAEESFTTHLDLKEINEILDANFDHPVWAEISETCMSCGSCSFMCPTCHCFDVIDEYDQYTNEGRRIRTWDTCQFCLYALHTSGHNPRTGKEQRCRNRILHKFRYYPNNYNLLGCVGCGRCIMACPVNNDLRLIISKIKNIEKEKEGEKGVA